MERKIWTKVLAQVGITGKDISDTGDKHAANFTANLGA